MRITKEEFAILWGIHYLGQYDPYRTSNGTPEGIKRHMKLFLRLDEHGFIRLDVREDRFYGACMTKSGIAIVKDPRYDKWCPE